jgi:hypothetical protein
MAQPRNMNTQFTSRQALDGLCRAAWMPCSISFGSGSADYLPVATGDNEQFTKLSRCWCHLAALKTELRTGLLPNLSSTQQPKGQCTWQGSYNSQPGISRAKDDMTAGTLKAIHGQLLLGRTVLTVAMGTYPGGLAKIVKLNPDDSAPEIAFQVQHPIYGEIGVFDYEPIQLINRELSR